MTQHIFSNGTQFQDWQCSNCERCTKGAVVCLEPGQWPTCEIEAALVEAACTDGKVTAEIAKRAGVSEETKFSYVWMCTEVVWTDEWKKKAGDVTPRE